MEAENDEQEMKRMKIQKMVKFGNRKALIFAVLILTLVSVGIGCASATITVCHSGCDNASIQAAVDAADSGVTIEVHSGTYHEHVYVNKTLILKGVDTGSGKPVVDAGGNDSAFTLSVDGITLEGFNVTNAGGGSWVPYGYVVLPLSVDGITLEGFNTTNAGGGSWVPCKKFVPGVKERSAGITVISNNNIITNNTASNSGVGIHLSSSSNNTFTGNTISNNHWDGIRLNSSCNNTITGNNVSNNNWDGIRLHFSCNNTITGNNVSNNNWDGIRLHSSSNNTITGNNASNNGCGICLGDSSNNIITGNNASNNGCSGIRLFSACNNTITNNAVSNNDYGCCISLTNSGCNNNIIGNTFVNNGLCVGASYQNTVENNTVNGKPLVYLVDTSDTEVTDAGQVILVNCRNITVENLDLSNTCVGIELYKTHDSIISNNTVSNNNMYGIILWDSSINTITGNNVSNNGEAGIWLLESNNNNFYLNNFINNSLSVGYSSTSNILNSTEQITYTYNGSTYTNYLGNYWSDYKDKYPDAKETEDCGIWDTPYSMPYRPDSDNYPLMLPWENYLSPTEPYTKTDVGVNSTLTPASPSDLAAYLPPEYSGMDLSDAVVVNVDVRDDAPENETDDAYSDITIKVGELDRETCKVFKTDIGFLPEVNDLTTLPTVSGDPAYSRDVVNKTVTVRLYVGDPLLGVIPAAVEPLGFDTGEGTYPSIKGTHNGTIIPSRDLNVSKLYTYSCAGTGGHTESIKLYENSTLIASGSRAGYEGDWHNITIENETGASYVMLLKGHEYNYTIVTGSYPQIIHEPSKEVTGGTITCSSFVDVNGKVYYDWIPAIRLE